MTTAYITARTPQEVAREVDSKVRAGCGRFVLSELDGEPSLPVADAR